MTIHHLLARQLRRIRLDPDNPPQTTSEWQEFLSKIDKTYQESDQERYLLERSMEISSRELMGLNEKLVSAQRIARLGYWYFDNNTKSIFCSNEVYEILAIEPLYSGFTYGIFLSLVHPDERDSIANQVRESTNKEIFELEVRIRNLSNEYRWYRIISHYHDDRLSGVVIDVNKDKEAEAKIRELNQKLLVTARRAGMSEVATSILHNIGNILNSSNVSINVLKENLNQSYYLKFTAICTMLKEHIDDLASYLTEDEKGSLIPKYLIALLDTMVPEWEKNIQEINSIDQDLQHIKTIVAMQQTVGGVDGVKEEIYVPDLIETALQMSSNKTKDPHITIFKSYSASSHIIADKSKLLQILVNLIQNAKDAVSDNGNKVQQIKFEVGCDEKNKLSIKVEDNGAGISPENLTRIFSFGFTTKKNGHGFGLHSSALSAQDMGGVLCVESKGMGEGACFTLTLPMINGHREKGVFNE